ncbi:MAG: hypothetical protein GX538_04115 [Gammaproteobacteria bacterium]|nr:hypothetical protein [Gammaproteobacteria bacterium]
MPKRSTPCPSRRWRGALAAMAVLALAGCDPAPTPDTDPHLQPVPDVARGDNAFQVQVTLSEAAAAALGGNGERVVVKAEYFGYPSVSAQERQLPGASGPRVQLATREVALEGSGVARFEDLALDPDALQMVEQGRPHVRLGAAARTEGDDAADGLLDCGTYQDTLAAATRSVIEIECRLVTE